MLIPEDYDITQDTYYYPWMIAQENGLSRPLLAKDVIRIYRWAIGRDIKALNVWAARVAPVMVPGSTPCACNPLLILGDRVRGSVPGKSRSAGGCWPRSRDTRTTLAS